VGLVHELLRIVWEELPQHLQIRSSASFDPEAEAFVE
jgi:hypothetical protein